MKIISKKSLLTLAVASLLLVNINVNAGSGNEAEESEPTQIKELKTALGSVGVRLGELNERVDAAFNAATGEVDNPRGKEILGAWVNALQPMMDNPAVNVVMVLGVLYCLTGDESDANIAYLENRVRQLYGFGSNVVFMVINDFKKLYDIAVDGDVRGDVVSYTKEHPVKAVMKPLLYLLAGYTVYEICTNDNDGNQMPVSKTKAGKMTFKVAGQAVNAAQTLASKVPSLKRKSEVDGNAEAVEEGASS